MKINKILYLLIAASVTFFTIFSCENSTKPSNDALLLNITQVQDSYPWYKPEFNIYQPPDTSITKIKQLFDPAKHKFVLFAQMGCTCLGTQKNFPHLMKILNSANIPEANYEIYQTPAATSKNPYAGVMTINSLPAFFLLKDGKPVYSIMDSIADVNSPDISIEDEVIKALKK